MGSVLVKPEAPLRSIGMLRTATGDRRGHEGLMLGKLAGSPGFAPRLVTLPSVGWSARRIGARMHMGRPRRETSAHWQGGRRLLRLRRDFVPRPLHSDSQTDRTGAAGPAL
jgi:hypothetical protein